MEQESELGSGGCQALAYILTYILGCVLSPRLYLTHMLGYYHLYHVLADIYREEIEAPAVSSGQGAAFLKLHGQKKHHLRVVETQIRFIRASALLNRIVKTLWQIQHCGILGAH